MKKALLPLLLAALAIPGAALAKPGHPGQGTHAYGRAKVMYVLSGTLSGYTAYDSSTSTNGSITIAVKHASRRARILKTLTLTLPVGANTRVVLTHGATGIADGDRGVVAVRAPRGTAAADLGTALEAAVPSRIVDRGAPPTG